MRFYLDANVLLALFIPDVHSPAVDAWLDRDPGEIYVSDFARLEFSAVVSRQVRNRLFDEQAARDALGDFDEWARRMTNPVEVGPRDLSLADRLTRDFATKLAAADAMHLAMALNHDLTLATYDTRLSEAGGKKGATVITPQ